MKKFLSLILALCMVLTLLAACGEEPFDPTYDDKKPTTPTANSFPTKDGKWIQLCGPTHDWYYARLMRLIGRDDLVEDERYSTIAALKENGLTFELNDIIEEHYYFRDSIDSDAAFAVETF